MIIADLLLAQNSHSFFLMEPTMKLFSPVQLGSLTLRNRIVFPPMSTKFAAADGTVTERMINYYEARAMGGAGLVTLEATYVHPSGNSFSRGLGLSDDRMIPGLKNMVSRMKKHGARVSIQLQHGGRAANSAATGQAVLVVSSIPGVTSYTDTREISEEEIAMLISAWGDAAVRAREAGLDAIELHGAHGYLISQFFSPYTNHRQDEWGGSLENRMRFALEVYREVRRRVGDDFPITYRMSAVEGLAGGITLEDSQALSRALVAEGINGLHVSVGLRETNFMVSPPSCVPRGWNADLSRSIRESINAAVPVIVAGRVTDEDVAERILEEEKADLVAMGRALIADPFLPDKLQNSHKPIIRCISCNEGCVGGSARGTGVGCALNPLSGMEKAYNLSPAATPKKVMVIGAGPAGMEAALVAATRGHKVTLLEKGPALGGLLATAALPPYKQDLTRIMNYYEKALALVGVHVRLNEEAGVELVKSEQPEVVVLATGSQPVFPGFCRVPGAMTASDALHGADTGDNPLVLGGGLIGAETSDLLSEQGKHVTLLEMQPDIAKDMEGRTRRYLLLRLKERKTTILTSTQVLEITPERAVRVKDPEGLERWIGPFSSVVVAVGYRSNRTLAHELSDAGIPFVTVGDCTKVGKIMTAIEAGFKAALSF